MTLPTKSRRSSLRLNKYDYTQSGAYFVTICTNKRNFLFGQVTNGEMLLNLAGRLVKEEWLNLPALRPQVKLDEFIVMPNHFHAILLSCGESEGTASRAPTIEHFGQPVPGSLSSIIRGFKSGVTNRLNLRRHNPGDSIWQRSFYEHVIRQEESLNRIREYITTNPLRWEFDRENPHRKGEDEFDRWLALL